MSMAVTVADLPACCNDDVVLPNELQQPHIVIFRVHEMKYKYFCLVSGEFRNPLPELRQTQSFSIVQSVALTSTIPRPAYQHRPRPFRVH